MSTENTEVPMSHMRAAFEVDWIARGMGRRPGESLKRENDGYFWGAPNVAWTTWQRAWRIASEVRADELRRIIAEMRDPKAEDGGPIILQDLITKWVDGLEQAMGGGE